MWKSTVLAGGGGGLRTTPMEAPDAAAAAEEGGAAEVKPEYGFGSLFRFATGRDKAVLAVGVVNTLVLAAGMPALNIVFGGMMDDVYTPDSAAAGEKFTDFAKLFAWLGLVMACTAFLQMVCFDLFAEWQVRTAALFVRLLRIASKNLLHLSGRRRASARPTSRPSCGRTRRGSTRSSTARWSCPAASPTTPP